MATLSVNRGGLAFVRRSAGQTIRLWHAPRRDRDALVRAVAAFCVLALLATAGHAAPTSEGALPWDTPIDRISQAIAGPVAFLFALGGMVVLGVRWIFGGEMGGMVRALLNTIIGLCLLVLAARFIQTLFGITGALVAG